MSGKSRCRVIRIQNLIFMEITVLIRCISVQDILPSLYSIVDSRTSPFNIVRKHLTDLFNILLFQASLVKPPDKLYNLPLFCHPLSFPDFPKTETDMLRILISILLVFTVFYKIKPIIFCVFHIIIRNHVFLQELSVNEKAAIRILLPDNGLLYDCYLKIPFFLCFSPSELSPPIASSNLRSASF